MSDDITAWVARLAAALALEGGDLIATDSATMGALLRITREVAHETERLNAPLCAYVAGRHVAARIAAGADEATAVAEVADAVRRTLAGDPPA